MRIHLLIFLLVFFFFQIQCKKVIIAQLLVEDYNLNSIQVQSPIKYLALGDSYTIGHNVDQALRYPVLLSKELNSKGVLLDSLQIIAQTGWTTNNLLIEMEIANLQNQYDLVSILIGVNNEFQGIPIATYEDEFEQIVQRAIDLTGGRKHRVFVLSIPNYAYSTVGANFPDAEAISQRLLFYNEKNRAISAKYGVRYFNITPISQQGINDPSLITTDGLHPSGKMYNLWVKLIEQGVYKMLFK